MLAVRTALLQSGIPREFLDERELITITLNSKCRVDEAVAKFKTYRKDLLEAYGIDDVFSTASETVLAEHWHRYAVAGVDEEGRQIMWINGGGTQPDEEHACIWASTLYFFAVHADLVSLRNGITLVTDTSNAPKKKVGNERKLQIAWQTYPTRPQHIYILGTSSLTRIAINALIAIASVFAQHKVIARIQFTDLAKVCQLVGKANLPERHGGVERAATKEWVMQRLASFPLMGLPDDIL